MKNTKLKRLLSFVMALAMVMSYVVMPVAAVGEEPVDCTGVTDTCTVDASGTHTGECTKGQPAPAVCTGVADTCTIDASGTHTGECTKGQPAPAVCTGVTDTCTVDASGTHTGECTKGQPQTDPCTEGTCTHIAKVGAAHFETLTAALATENAAEGKLTIELLNTVTISETLTIPENVEVTLTTNGKMIVAPETTPFSASLVIDGSVYHPPIPNIIPDDTTMDTKAELEAAITAAEEGSTVTLNSNIDFGNDYLTISKKITLDLNGYTISSSYNGSYGAITIGTAGDVTIKATNGGGITNSSYSALVNFGTLTVEGGTFTGDYALFNCETDTTNSAPVVYLNGGTFNANKDDTYSVCNSGNMTISGADVNGMMDSSAKLTVSGGTIDVLYLGSPNYTPKVDCVTNISGGSITTVEVYTDTYSGTTENKVTISGSSTIGTLVVDTYDDKAQVNSVTMTGGTVSNVTVDAASSEKLSITGGNVPDSAADYVESGKMVDESGNVVDADYEAYIETDGSTGMTSTEKGYATLEKAIEAATDNQTVVLLKDTDSNGFTLSGKALTIDLNTKTLSGQDDVTVNSNLTIQNGTVDISGAVANGDALFEVGKNGTVTLTLDGVDLKGTNYNSAYAVFYLFNASTLNINGGSVKLSGEQHAAGGVFKENLPTDGCTLNITGTADDPVEIRITNGNVSMLNLTTTMNYVDLDITGGGNAINQTALTANNSTIDIQNPNGRALTPLMSGGMKFNNTQLNLSGATEGEIRFKESVTMEFTGDSSLNECNIYADSEKNGTVKGEDTIGNSLSVSVNGSKATETKPDSISVVKDVLTHVGYAVAQIGTGDDAQRFETLVEALNAAEAGNTITLLTDVTEDVQITNNKKVTLDLNGKTLTTKGILNTTGELTVQNGTVVGTEKDTIRSEGGTLILNNVNATGVRHTVRITAGTATINGGEYKAATKGGTATLHALNVGDYDNGHVVSTATVTINGGTFVGPDGTNADSGSAICVQTGSTVTIPKTSTAEFKGGKNATLSAQEGATLSVDGGTYDQDVTEFCVAGRKAVLNDSGMYEIVDRVYVAQVGNDKYETLQEAVAAVTDANGTVTLLTDVTEVVTISGGKTVVLEMNGKTLTGSILAPNANLTVQNGSIVNTDNAVSALEINAGTLTLTNMEMDSYRHAIRIDGAVEAIINSGTYQLSNHTETMSTHAINVSGTANVTIKGGTFTGAAGFDNPDSGAAVNVQSGATVTIEAGSFSGGQNDTLANEGTLTIKGGTYDQDPTAHVADGYCVAESNGWYKVEKHTLSYKAYKAAECEVVGNVACWYCENCKVHYSDENGTEVLTVWEIPATDHNYDMDEWTYDSETHWHACKNDSTHKKDEQAHNWSEWQRANTRSTVQEIRSCQDCGYVATRDVHVHDYVIGGYTDAGHELICGDTNCNKDADAKKTVNHSLTIDSNKDGQLDKCICGYSTVKHVHNMDWKHNSSKHWQECTSKDGLACDHKEVKENHTWGSWEKGKADGSSKSSWCHKECKICGYIIERHVVWSYSDNPKTGDYIMIAVGIMFVSAAALVTLLIVKRKKR